MRYGIPNFKLDKRLIDRRVEQMEAEGTVFRTGVEIGKDISWDDLRSRYDAVVVAIGSTVPRDMKIPGRELKGIHFAMEFLPTRPAASTASSPVNDITAEGKHVVIIGGGDTGSDCPGHVHPPRRQGRHRAADYAAGTKRTPRPTSHGRPSRACTRRPPPWKKASKPSAPSTCTARIL